jgi:colicin import membrane protein
LTDSKNAPKAGGGPTKGGRPAGQGNSKQSGASGADISGYGDQVKAAIQQKFYEDPAFSGKTCTLRMNLAPDGLLISVSSEGGDPALCQAAIAAAKSAKIPRPPSQAVYEAFKDASLVFKPE